MKPVICKSLQSLLLLSVLGISHTSYAKEQDITDPIAHGEKAHSEHCVRCHTDAVYTRENRFVRSLDALNKQVTRCRDMIGIKWFDEDTDAVVQFLNQKYYRF